MISARRSLTVCLLFLVFVHISQQCTCDWRYRLVEGTHVSNSLCYKQKKYIVFTPNNKRTVSGPSGNDNIDGRVEFDATMSKLIRNGEVTEFPGGRSVTLSAPVADSLCGYIDFELGATYYLSVNQEVQDVVDFNGCHYGRRTKDMTETECKLINGDITCPKAKRPH